MSEFWALVEGSEGVMTWNCSRDGERSVGTYKFSVSFPPDLRVLPCGFPVPRGEGLGSRIVKDESLSPIYWISQCRLSHPTSRWVYGGMTGRGRHKAASAQGLWASAKGGQTSKHRPALVF